MGSKTKDRKKRKRKKDAKRVTQASLADRYKLYVDAVQEVDADLEFFEEVFVKRFGRKPRTLREDFCGTAKLACHFVQQDSQNEAWGVDLDPVPMAWGRSHHISKLTDDERTRLRLIEGDVMDAGREKVDIVAAQNFSFCIFKTRAKLRSYFEAARAGLNEDGLLILDIFGGPDSQMPSEEETEHDEFSYVWDQKFYDAITNEIRCAIHFVFPDGSCMEDAFEYDWRLWTIQELKELLIEAGFTSAEAYWEGTEEDDDDDEEFAEGNGEFTLQNSAENEDAWISYVVGVN